MHELLSVPSPAADDDLDDGPPDAALLVGCTMALMTSWALHDAPEVDGARGGAAAGTGGPRGLMARKIVSNLFFLQHHPAVDAGLRRVIGNVHAHWRQIAQGEAPAEAAPRRAPLH
jgi:hypothetical protein